MPAPRSVHPSIPTLSVLLAIVLGLPTAALSRTLMILNPWDGQLGVVPQASFNGSATWQAGKSVPGFCGWYSMTTTDSAKTVRFSTGTGTPTSDVALHWSADTMYVSGASTNSPLVSRYFNGLTGMCLVALLPATIRDFDSGSQSPDFDSGGFPVDTLWKGLVQPTLGSNGTPVQSAAGAKYFKKFDQWFRSDTTVNATTCTEIKLDLNATGADKGLYTKYDSVYFPIDNFKNKFNNLVDRPTDPRYLAEEDSLPHNFSFCLESHAEFVYTPGQKFKFSGDDDVWVFIDKKLVIDLGGIHSESSDSVLLDTMKLTQGRTYSWDFFFCERHIHKSHLRINTDLNLRGRSTFRINKLPGANAKITRFTIQGDRPGLGCASRIDFSSLGRFFLQDSRSTKSLPVGASFGGISVDSELGSVTIDTSKMTGLEPGTYRLRTAAWGDSTVYQDFTFSIPPRPIPVFAGSKPSFSGAIGTGLWIPVSEIRPDNKVSTGQAVVFLMRTQPGLTFCVDSLCAKKLASTDTLMTGTNGTSRRLWVRGDAAGTYNLVVKTAGGDSTDNWPKIVFVDGSLRFTDSTWRAYDTVPAIDTLVRTPVLVHIASLVTGKVCSACTDTVLFSSVFPGLEFRATPAGEAIESIVLTNGKANFWIWSATPVTRTSFEARSANKAASKDTWSPVTFRALVPDSGWFVDRNGDGRADGATIYLHQPWSPANVLRLAWPGRGDTLTIAKSEITTSGDSLKISVALGPDHAFGADLTAATGSTDSLGQWSWDTSWSLGRFPLRDSIAPVPVRATIAWAVGSSASDTLRVDASESLADLDGPDLLRFALSGLPNIVPQSYSLSKDGKQIVLLFHPDSTRTEPQPGDSIRFSPGPTGNVKDGLGNIPGLEAKAVIVVGPTHPPRAAAMFDPNGDGRADRAVVRLWTPLSPKQTLRLAWPGVGDTVEVDPTWIRFSGDSLTLTITFPKPFGADRTEAATPGALLGLLRDPAATAPAAFPVDDSIAPVPVRATIAWAVGSSASDTLRVDASESLADLDGPDLLRFALSGLPKIVPQTYSLSKDGKQIVLLFHPDSTRTEPQPGDSIRFSPGPTGNVKDGLGNIPGLEAKAVIVVGPTHPPRAAAMFDPNGDGRANLAVVRLWTPLSPKQTLRLAWPGVGDTVEVDPTWIRFSGDSLTLTIAFPKPFGVDRTAAASGALLGLLRDPAATAPVAFSVDDSIAPVPVKAWLVYASNDSAPDTLKVTSSETLRGLSLSDVARIFHAAGDNWTLGNQIDQKLSASGDTLLLMYDPSKTLVEPAPGDSVRFSPRAGTADRLGNRPGDTAKAVVILGTDRPPLWARIFDTNGDGKADRVVMRFRGPLQNTGSFDFLWPDTLGNLDKRHVSITRTRTDSGGLIVIAELDVPFAYGSTACPASGCADLGSMSSANSSDSVRTKFPVLDGVDPIVLGSKLRFSFREDQPDTLKLIFSEPISIEQPGYGRSSSWIAWGHDSKDSLGSKVPFLGTNRVDGTHADLLVRVSDSFPLTKNDSLRISMGGLLSDTSGNQPKELAHWTPISFGPTPLRLRAKAYVPVRTYHADWGEPSKNVDNVTILVRGSGSASWKTLDGKPSPIDTSRLSGVVMRTDRMVIGGFYLYDNMGVFVTSADVGAVNKALLDGSLVPDPRGFYEVFFAWNGRADGGEMASTGVYFTRIFGWKIEVNERVLINEIHSIGWRVVK